MEGVEEFVRPLYCLRGVDLLPRLIGVVSSDRRATIQQRSPPNPVTSLGLSYREDESAFITISVVA
jgi:hypothetical protein